MSTYFVSLTMVHNATIEVDAESPEEAMIYVNDNLDDIAPNSIFQFGEKTVDYADSAE